jgi:cyclopropane-fatty-acyl-phospholipid synthase
MGSVASQVQDFLGRAAGGRLARLPFAISFWDGSAIPAPDGAVAPSTIAVERRALAHLLRQPNQLGLTRAYVAGALRVERGRLEDVLAWRSALADVRLSLGERITGLALALRVAGISLLRPPRVPGSELRPAGRRHSLRRDRTVVRHHYEISNDFYQQLLGPSLVYSCAYFAEPGESLEAAQARKLELICRKLRLAQGDRFLDIGCGWGSLVLHAAAHHGVRATGITLSQAQAQLARRRIAEAGLSDRCEIRVADYRETHDGPYDKVASVGMYEHVGAAQLDTYAQTLHRLLCPGGLVLNHGISRLASATPAGDKSLIQRYVFPDGELQPLPDIVAALHRAGLETRDVESLREHYPLTLRRWLANLDDDPDAATAAVGAERVRVWRLYLTGSALAFDDGDITLFQVLASRRDGPHGLGLVRGE